MNNDNRPYEPNLSGTRLYKAKGMVPLTGWVHPDVRDDAKLLAGSLGMTLGEYLAHLIDEDDRNRNS